MRAALDTNILAYAEGTNGQVRQQQAITLFRTIPRDRFVLPVQVLGELFNVLTRKAGWTRQQARDAVLSWRDSMDVIDTTQEIMLMAAELASDHQLPIWDSVILSAASVTGCRVLLSEDFSNGFTWASVTIVNPFSPDRHPLLDALSDNA